MDKLLTVRELCETLRVHETTIYRWIKDGMPVEIRRPNLFKYEDVKNWLNNVHYKEEEDANNS